MNHFYVLVPNELQATVHSIFSLKYAEEPKYDEIISALKVFLFKKCE